MKNIFIIFLLSLIISSCSLKKSLTTFDLGHRSINYYLQGQCNKTDTSLYLKFKASEQTYLYNFRYDPVYIEVKQGDWILGKLDSIKLEKSQKHSLEFLLKYPYNPKEEIIFTVKDQKDERQVKANVFYFCKYFTFSEIFSEENVFKVDKQNCLYKDYIHIGFPNIHNIQTDITIIQDKSDTLYSKSFYKRECDVNITDIKPGKYELILHGMRFRFEKELVIE